MSLILIEISIRNRYLHLLTNRDDVDNVSLLTFDLYLSTNRDVDLLILTISLLELVISLLKLAISLFELLVREKNYH